MKTVQYDTKHEHLYDEVTNRLDAITELFGSFHPDEDPKFCVATINLLDLILRGRECVIDGIHMRATESERQALEACGTLAQQAVMLADKEAENGSRRRFRRRRRDSVLSHEHDRRGTEKRHRRMATAAQTGAPWVAWYRPSSKTPWRRVGVGESWSAAMGASLEHKRQGDYAVLPAGTDPNQRRATA